MARRKFRLDPRNGKFMGVCAGIANHFGWDVTLVRVGAVVVTLLGGFPWTLIAYGLAGWLAKPLPVEHYEMEDIRTLRGSTNGLRRNMRDIDTRLSDIDGFVARSNTGLADEIEKLR